MSLIRYAVEDGIRCGFESVAASKCDGRDNPDERCPEKTSDCVCAWVHYQSRSWLYNLCREKPPRPSEDSVRKKMIKDWWNEVHDK